MAFAPKVAGDMPVRRLDRLQGGSAHLEAGAGLRWPAEGSEGFAAHIDALRGAFTRPRRGSVGGASGGAVAPSHRHACSRRINIAQKRTRLASGIGLIQRSSRSLRIKIRQ